MSEPVPRPATSPDVPSNPEAAAASAEGVTDALTVSERQYRRLFEAARDGILLLDSEQGRITDANPFMTELLGYTRAELLGKELWEIGLLQDKAASQEAFLRLHEDGYIRYEDLPLENRRGERREVEFVSNLYREDGHTVIQCNIRDITERRRAAAALLAAAARHAHQDALLQERARLAREIHDTLAQGFTGIITQLEAAEAALANAPELTPDATAPPAPFAVHRIQMEKVRTRIGKARVLARESLDEARRSVAALRATPLPTEALPPPLQATPLGEALAAFLAQKLAGAAAEGRCILEGTPRALPATAGHCLLRVGQEAIANAVAHADAGRIDVSLTFEADRVRLAVRDDGRGFDPARPGDARFGIIGMRERAEKVGGVLSVSSRAGAGTEIALSVPTPPDAHSPDAEGGAGPIASGAA